jgi:hypothetical protein
LYVAKLRNNFESYKDFDKKGSLGNSCVCLEVLILFKQKPINPLSEKVTLPEYCTLSVVNLLVCEHTARLTTNSVIPYQGLFLIKEKPGKPKAEPK